MTLLALGNLLWCSLRILHGDTALVCGEVARYPAAFAPFLGVAYADLMTADAI